MNQSNNWESFKKRRMVLTKTWFLLFLFNGILQLDVVEKWFEPASEITVVSVSNLECSSYGRVGIPEDPAQELLSFLPMSLSLAHSKKEKKSLLPVAGIQGFGYKFSQLTKKAYDFSFYLRDLSQKSGLSPPEFL